MRYHNTHQPSNIANNENQASRTNSGHQGQIYIFGGQGSQGVYHMGLSDRQLGTFCSLIFQIKVIPEIQNAYLFSYIGVSLSLFLYLFCPF